jgi:hypothetical protein
LAKIRLNALWIFVALRDPKNIALTSVAIKKKFHPAARIVRSRGDVSGTLTALHPSKKGSVSTPMSFGIPGHSLIRIVPT